MGQVTGPFGAINPGRCILSLVGGAVYERDEKEEHKSNNWKTNGWE
jgi:hypothetical protein